VKKIYLDAREMEHPKPLEYAISALRELNEDEYFYMLHRKNPIPLLSLARGEHFHSLSYEEEEGLWHILICKDKRVDLDGLIERSMASAQL
jgi:hypothetical protein